MVGADSVVLCFLITNEFETEYVWRRWIGTTNVPIVVHANLRTDLIARFVSDVNARWLNPLETSWGSFELVLAEVALFDAAKREFPDATHYLLVSQNSIPLMTAQYLNDLCSTRLRNKSRLNWCYDDCGNNAKKLFAALSVFPSVAAQQFLLLHADHFADIRGAVIDACDLGNGRFCDDWYEVCPSEFVIPTLLYSRYADFCEAGRVIDAEFTWKTYPRACYRSRAWLAKHIVKLKNGDAIGLRKVRKYDCEYIANVLFP